MSVEDNKAVVVRWFADFWGSDMNAEELGLDDGVMVLKPLGLIPRR